MIGGKVKVERIAQIDESPVVSVRARGVDFLLRGAKAKPVHPVLGLFPWRRKFQRRGGKRQCNPEHDQRRVVYPYDRSRHPAARPSVRKPSRNEVHKNAHIVCGMSCRVQEAGGVRAPSYETW